MRFPILGLAALAGAAGITPAFAASTTVYYEDFRNVSAFTFNGSAAQRRGTTGKPVIRLTPSRGGQSGAAYLTTPIVRGPHGEFETQFQFQIHDGNPTGNWSDGLTFVITSTPNEIGTETGSGIGYSGDPGSIAVAFDTCAYPNEVGLVQEGDLSTLNTVSGAWSYAYGQRGSCGVSGAQPSLWLADGDIWTADIKYDGTYFNVVIQDGSNPVYNAVTNYETTFPAALRSGPVYVGFTAGTGAGYADYDILDWELRY